jgi:hypothetical protein
MNPVKRKIVQGGGESLFHFVLRCLFSKAVYEKNREFRKRPGENLVESEKQFFEKLKHRGDVYDPFTRVLYEIQRDAKEIKKKKGVFYRSKDVDLVKFINPEVFPDSDQFEGILAEIFKEINRCVEEF